MHLKKKSAKDLLLYPPSVLIFSLFHPGFAPWALMLCPVGASPFQPKGAGGIGHIGRIGPIVYHAALLKPAAPSLFCTSGGCTGRLWVGQRL